MNRMPLLAALLALAPALALAQASPAAAPQELPADAMFRAWDSNKDGSLSKEEFRAGWAGLRQRAAADAEARLRLQFDRADANDDQGIDANEYKSLLLVRRAGATAPPLSRFDADKDGKLQFPEYLVMVQELAPRPAAPAAAEGKR